MNFENLDVRNFRNIRKISIPFHRGFNIFVGDNGQGKTNLIEALFYLANGSSFRTHQVGHFLNNLEPNAPLRISSVISRGLLSDRLTACLSAQTRSLDLNEKRVSVQKLCREFPTILFSPESLVAIKSGPEHRRSLIDDVVKHSREFGAELLLEYRKVLMTRNRLLRDRQKAGQPNHSFENVFESVNASFLRAAVSLVNARIELVEAINPIILEIYRSLLQEPNVDLHVDYVISDHVANKMNIQEIYSALSQQMDKRRGAELSFGSSLVGPHKHDIRFICNGNDSRFFCSQGQQRALILAFKITQIVYHRQTHDVSPILFLDDVLSELDYSKRSYLLRFLRDHDSQTFITTTDVAQLGDFEMNDLGTFRIHDGQVDDGVGLT